MAKKQDKLFQLVQTMSQAERKKYREQHSAGGETSINLQLFNLLCQQKQYDEIGIQKALGYHDNERQFGPIKNHLLRSVLSFLRANNAHFNVRNEIRQQLDYVDICLHRGLREEALRCYNKALKLSNEAQQYAYLADLKSYEVRLFYENLSNAQLGFENLIAGGEDVIRHLQSELEARAYMYQIIAITSGPLPRAEQIAAIEKIIEDCSLTQPGGEASTFGTEVSALEFYQRLYEVKGEFDKVFEYAQKIQDCWERNPKFISIRAGGYLTQLVNYNEGCITYGDQEMARIALERLHSFKSPVKRLMERAKSYYLLNCLGYFIQFGLYEEAREFLSEKEQIIWSIRKQMYHHTAGTLMYRVILLYYWLGAYDKLEKWMDSMVLQEKFHPSQAHVVNCLLLRCLISLDEEDYGFSPYLIRQYDKQVNRLSEGKEAQKAIVKALSTFAQKRQLDKAVIIELQAKLKEFDYRKEMYSMSLFDINYWIEAQLTNADLKSLPKYTLKTSQDHL